MLQINVSSQDLALLIHSLNLISTFLSMHSTLTQQAVPLHPQGFEACERLL